MLDQQAAIVITVVLTLSEAIPNRALGGGPPNERETEVQKVIVEPVNAGWTVHVAGIENPMLYRSGREAERAGRDLALRLAENGQEIELELRLRGGALGAKFICFPALEHETGPLMLNTRPVRFDRSAEVP